MTKSLWMPSMIALMAMSLSAPAFATVRSGADILKEHKFLAQTQLLSYQANEVSSYVAGKDMGVMNPLIETMNQLTLEELKSLPVEREVENRFAVVEPDLAEKILHSINNHPVVSIYQYSKYNTHPGVEIGFCFGRATYAHLMALHLGVVKESIKKAWLVGPMNAGGNVWGFHVATIVRSKDGNWLVLDSNEMTAMPVQDWYKKYSQYSTDGRLRLYITQANKFSVDLGKYDKVQMGLNLDKSQDWYSGYFKDMMAWFQQNDGEPDLTSLGLPNYQELRVQYGMKPLPLTWTQKIIKFIKDMDL